MNYEYVYDKTEGNCEVWFGEALVKRWHHYEEGVDTFEETTEVAVDFCFMMNESRNKRLKEGKE